MLYQAHFRSLSRYAMSKGPNRRKDRVAYPGDSLALPLPFPGTLVALFTPGTVLSLTQCLGAKMGDLRCEEVRTVPPLQGRSQKGSLRYWCLVGVVSPV